MKKQIAIFLLLTFSFSVFAESNWWSGFSYVEEMSSIDKMEKFLLTADSNNFIVPDCPATLINDPRFKLAVAKDMKLLKIVRLPVKEVDTKWTTEISAEFTSKTDDSKYQVKIECELTSPYKGSK